MSYNNNKKREQLHLKQITKKEQQINDLEAKAYNS